MELTLRDGASERRIVRRTLIAEFRTEPRSEPAVVVVIAGPMPDFPDVLVAVCRQVRMQTRLVIRITRPGACCPVRSRRVELLDDPRQQIEVISLSPGSLRELIFPRRHLPGRVFGGDVVVHPDVFVAAVPEDQA